MGHAVKTNLRPGDLIVRIDLLNTNMSILNDALDSMGVQYNDMAMYVSTYMPDNDRDTRDIIVMFKGRLCASIKKYWECIQT